jgi:hypothetical protein
VRLFFVAKKQKYAVINGQYRLKAAKAHGDIDEMPYYRTPLLVNSSSHKGRDGATDQTAAFP